MKQLRDQKHSFEDCSAGQNYEVKQQKNNNSIGNNCRFLLSGSNYRLKVKGQVKLVEILVSRKVTGITGIILVDVKSTLVWSTA